MDSTAGSIVKAGTSQTNGSMTVGVAGDTTPPGLERFFEQPGGLRVPTAAMRHHGRMVASSFGMLALMSSHSPSVTWALSALSTVWTSGSRPPSTS